VQIIYAQILDVGGIFEEVRLCQKKGFVTNNYNFNYKSM
jgi:hypothetical protein